MAEQIKKGWLYTREDEKFAPNTLVENVYTRSGTPYDEQVRNYFEAVRRANATTEGETAAKLKEHTSKLENLQQQIINTQDDIEERLKHFQDIDDTGILYITDEAGHVIAYFDASGIHAVDVEIKSGMTLSQAESNISTLQTDLTEHDSRLNKLETKTQYQDITSEKTFFIVDKDDNVIGYFDEFGLHAVNILSGGSTTHPQVYDLNDELADIHQTESNLNDAIVAEAKAREDADLDLAADISQNDQTLTDMQNNFSWTDDNKRLYIIDGTAAQNVLAVFYDNGLMIPDVVIKDIKNNKEKNLRSSASYLTPEKEITITWL